MSRLWTLAAAVALALAAGPGGLIDELAHRSLPVHMLQHVLLTGAGAAVPLALGWRLPATGNGHWCARALIAASVVTVAGWHVPSLFGWAMAVPTVHGIMHLSYLAVGAALAAAVPRLSGGERLVMLLVVQALMMLLVLAMISRAWTYPSYPPHQTPPAAVVMLVGMQLGWIVVPTTPALGRLWQHSPALRSSVLVGLVVVAAAGGWT